MAFKSGTKEIIPGDDIKVDSTRLLSEDSEEDTKESSVKHYDSEDEIPISEATKHMSEEDCRTGDCSQKAYKLRHCREHYDKFLSQCLTRPHFRQCPLCYILYGEINETHVYIDVKGNIKIALGCQREIPSKALPYDADEAISHGKWIQLFVLHTFRNAGLLTNLSEFKVGGIGTEISKCMNAFQCLLEQKELLRISPKKDQHFPLEIRRITKEKCVDLMEKVFTKNRFIKSATIGKNTTPHKRNKTPYKRNVTPGKKFYSPAGRSYRKSPKSKD